MMGALLEFVAFTGVACGCIGALGYFIERRTDR
jgi:hypothetical protein